MSINLSDNSRKILIVGSGAAGFSAAKAARMQDPEAEIIMFGRDGRLPYYRLRLCEYIGRDVNNEELRISSDEWFKKNRIKAETASEVTKIDAENRKIYAGGREYSYDSLVLATGSTPAMPPFAGKELEGIHTLWTIEDVIGINRSLEKAKKAVVIGGGLLGLEAAYKISKTGIQVSLIEGMPRLLPKQLDDEGSEIFKSKVESLGISVFCGKSVTGFEGDASGHVRCINMADGASLEADTVIVSVGVRPNVELFRDTGISMNRFVSVNEKMETSVKGVYAAGDVACVNGRWFGQWSVATSQGQVAGTNAAGGNAVYKDIDVPYILNTMETRVVCSGDAGVNRQDETKAEYKTERKADRERFSYSRLVFRNGVFSGYMLVGEPAKAFNRLQPLINTASGVDKIYSIIYG